jgi:hypothetical protein
MDWRLFFQTIRLGNNMNKELIMGLISLNASFDHIIPEDKVELNRNYEIYKGMRDYIF